MRGRSKKKSRSTGGTWSSDVQCKCQLSLQPQKLDPFQIASAQPASSQFLCIKKSGKSLAKVWHENCATTRIPQFLFNKRKRRRRNIRMSLAFANWVQKNAQHESKTWVCEKNLQRPNSGARPPCPNLILQLQELKQEYKTSAHVRLLLGPSGKPLFEARHCYCSLGGRKERKNLQIFGYTHPQETGHVDMAYQWTLALWNLDPEAQLAQQHYLY